MTCPTCHAESYVTRTHGSRRTRRCLGCGAEFQTVEVYARDAAREDIRAESRYHAARIWAVVNENGGGK